MARKGAAGLIGMAIALLCAGCLFKPAHYSDLSDRVLKSYTGSDPDRLYYIGSQNGYDYFYLKNENQRYRVAENESDLDKRMYLTGDRSKWQVVAVTKPLESAEGN